MAPALVPRIAAAALPHARAARSRLVRAVRARVRVAASAGDDAEVTPERRLQLEKADALREEYDGVSTRARRLLTRGGRLAEKIDELTAAAERAMTLGADRDEDQARRLLRERAQVKEALDRTIAAEVLKELARKIEMAIIVYAGEIADESAESAVAAPSANAKDVAPGSLEAEFASLEINLLERAFAASGAAASETAPDARRNALGATATKREADASPVAAPRDVPGWWRDASDEDAPPKQNENESGGAPSAEKPLDALLSLDRARLLGRRAAFGRRAAARRVRRARRRGRRALEAPRGGKRDTAFRAGVEAACAAVETEEGRVEKEKELWRSLGGQEPLRFLVRPRARPRLASHARGRAGHRGGRAPRGEDARAVRGAHARARATGTTRGARASSWRGRSSPSRRRRASPEDRERVALVALRTQRQLREDERREVLALFSDEGRESESVREVIRLALGLEEERE